MVIVNTPSRLKCCWLSIVLSLFLLLFTTQIRANDCQQANELYLQALNTQSLAEKWAQLDRSAKLCPAYQNLFERAKTELAQNKPSQALQSLRAAEKYSDNPAQRSSIDAQIANIKLDQIQRTQSGAMLCEVAQRLNQARLRWQGEDIPHWITESLERSDRVRQSLFLDSEVIDCLLQIEMNQATKAVGVRPRIHLNINFAHDSDQLSTAGERQALALANSLSKQCYDKYRFTLVGHTDSVGDQDYNQALSLRRAQTVKAYFESKFSVLKNRISADGQGESDLKIHPERSADDRLVNRRVEAILIRR